MWEQNGVKNKILNEIDFAESIGMVFTGFDANEQPVYIGDSNQWDKFEEKRYEI
jgi:hypothetical protein